MEGSMGENRKLLIIWRQFIVPTREDKEQIIASFCENMNLHSRNKLHEAVSDRYSGISRRDVQCFLAQPPDTFARNAKFSNNPDLRSIDAPRPNQRHQTDLVDLANVNTGQTSSEYRYVLSVLDLFTRSV
jgi:hypothetical protein